MPSLIPMFGIPASNGTHERLTDCFDWSGHVNHVTAGVAYEKSWRACWSWLQPMIVDNVEIPKRSSWPMSLLIPYDQVHQPTTYISESLLLWKKCVLVHRVFETHYPLHKKINLKNFFVPLSPVTYSRPWLHGNEIWNVIIVMALPLFELFLQLKSM